MDSEVLRIGYAGTLAAWQPRPSRPPIWRRLKSLVWDYEVDNVHFHTRSGWFLFQGLKKLKEKYPEEARHIRVELWGKIEPLNQQQVKALGLEEMVQIEGFMAKEESHERLQACDMVFLPLETAKEGQEPLFIPGKLYEYLAFQKPILALGGEGDAAEIIRKSGLGVLHDPHDAEGIADLLAELVRRRSQLGERFQADMAYIESNFSFEHLSRKLADVFEDLLAPKARN